MIFLVYLDSIQENYPGGLPVSVLEEVKRIQAEVQVASQTENEELAAEEVSDGKLSIGHWGNPGANLVFLLLSDSPQSLPWSGPDGELLAAAIQKGMKRSLDEVEVFLLQKNAFLEQVASNSLGLEAQCATQLTFAPGAILVTLGEELSSFLHAKPLARGNWGQYRSERLLASHALSEVRTVAEKKRDFWQDLKQLMAALA